MTSASWTPLAYAIRTERPDLVSALLWAGADPWRYEPATRVIWRVMTQHPNDQISTLIQNHLVRPREPQPGALGWTYVSDIAERRCLADTQVVQQADLLTPIHPDMVFTYVSGELPPGLALADGLNGVAASMGASEIKVAQTDDAVTATWPTGYATFTAAAFKGSSVYCLYVHQTPRIYNALLEAPPAQQQ